MKRRLFLQSIVAAFPVAIGAAAPRTLGYPGTDFTKFPFISQGLRRASKVTLYKGLPHPQGEPQKFQQERESREALQLDGSYFDSRTLPIRPEDVEPLRLLCASRDNYTDYAPKLCGGFHADYGIAFQDGKATWYLLICFTCHEMKFYGPNIRLIADIKKEAYQQFKALLGKYGNQ